MTKILVGLLALALLSAGCGSAADRADPAAPADPSAAAAALVPAGQAAPAAAVEPARKKKRNIISWILSLGPGSPIGPPEFTAYRELQQLRCRAVFDRVGELDPLPELLYRGAAKACLAALAGKTRKWRGATAAYETVAPRAAELTCMDLAALGLLRRLVTKHERHPRRPFRLAPTERSVAPPCPDITAVVPDHGIADTAVEISGRFLTGTVTSVLVVDSTGGFTTPATFEVVDGTLRFAMPEAPPPEASPVVCIVLRADPDWSADGALFTYDPDPATSPSPSPTPAPAPACPPPDDR